MRRAIGGYFELELPQGSGAYHLDALPLNTARNALEYALKAGGFDTVFLPYYTCGVMLQPLRRLGIRCERYAIDKDLNPVFDLTVLKPGEAFVYTNYYGLKATTAAGLASQTDALIVDNAQAFFAKPLADVPTFYSARKFLGVPDGAYLYPTARLQESIERDTTSHERFAHLLLRAEADAEAGYAHFAEADASLDDAPIRRMSRLTEKVLAAVDYKRQRTLRRAHYTYLHDALGVRNELHLALEDDAVPMAYPFLIREGAQLRAALIAQRIYVPRYWPEVNALVAKDSVEADLAANLLPLPIDQRLTTEDLDIIIHHIQLYT